MNTDHKKTSKFLSLILRHQPGIIGLTLDKNGWAATDELLFRMTANGHPLTLEELKVMVTTNDKKRFLLSDDFKRIRAAQGHSIEIDLNLHAQTPPDVLYHGTAKHNIESIKEKGLIKGRRHHVHLSADAETATKVGMRYGQPVVLVIDAKRMNEEGFSFFQSENGVWLTENIPAPYIRFPAGLAS